MPAASNARPGSPRRALARNTLLSYANRFLRGFVAIALTAYLFKRIGADGFGTWSVLFAIATVWSLLEMGFTVGVQKHVAEHEANGSAEGIAADVAAAAAVLAGIAAVAGAATIAAAFLADGIASAGDREGFRLGMVLLGVAMLVRLPAYAHGAALIGIGRYDRFSCAEIVGTLVFATGAVAGVEAGGRVGAVAAAYAASLLVSGALFVVFLRRLHPEVAVVPRLGERERLREVSRFGGLALLADSMDFIAQRMDTVIVAALLSATLASGMAAATRLISGVQSLVLPFIFLVLPLVSSLQAAGDREGVARGLVLSSRLALQITLPVSALFALFASDTVQLWLGEEPPGSMTEIVAILMVVQVVTLTTTPAGKVLVGLGRVRAIAGLAALEGVANLALTIVLVRRIGPAGAAYGTLVTSMLIVPLRVPLACRAVGCPMARWVAEAVTPALIASVPTLLILVGLRLLAPEGDARLLAAASLGLGPAVAIGLAQIGPRRVFDRARLAA